MSENERQSYLLNKITVNFLYDFINKEKSIEITRLHIDSYLGYPFSNAVFLSGRNTGFESLEYQYVKKYIEIPNYSEYRGKLVDDIWTLLGKKGVIFTYDKGTTNANEPISVLSRLLIAGTQDEKKKRFSDLVECIIKYGSMNNTVDLSTWFSQLTTGFNFNTLYDEKKAKFDEGKKPKEGENGKGGGGANGKPKRARYSIEKKSDKWTFINGDQKYTIEGFESQRNKLFKGTLAGLKNIKPPITVPSGMNTGQLIELLIEALNNKQDECDAISASEDELKAESSSLDWMTKSEDKGGLGLNITRDILDDISKWKQLTKLAQHYFNTRGKGDKTKAKQTLSKFMKDGERPNLAGKFKDFTNSSILSIMNKFERSNKSIRER